ncbi:DUF4347 domain-containing protein [Phaeobacter sp. JH20_02]|uniref:DUF4347 domain-containing protein n=1 Tax=unclassified Phaeobacter TaxID=2621772 RepID=UPI003A873190
MIDTQYFVFDSAVDHCQTLHLDLPDDATVIYLTRNGSGLRQIAEALSAVRGLSALHIMSHGEDGALLIGDETVTEATLARYPEVMEVLRRALHPGGDILLYGCEVAATAKGEAFVAALAEATGANVAASRTLTGAAELGGDWDLEMQIGAISTPIGISAVAQAAYPAVLSTVLNYGNYTNGGNNKDAWADGSDGIADFPGLTLTLDFGDGSEGSSTFTNLNMRGAQNLAVGAVEGGTIGAMDGAFYNDDSNGFQLAGDGDFSFEGFRVLGRAQSITSQTFTIRGFDSSGTEIVSDTLTWAAAGSNALVSYSIGSGDWDADAAWGSVRRIAVDYTNEPSFQEFAVLTMTVDTAVVSANNAPLLGGTPPDNTATEDVATAIDLSAYNISDADGDTITLTLAVDRGTIATTDGNGTTAGVTVANSGTGSMTLQGSAADLNTYLNDTSKLRYTTASNDTTTAVLTVTPNDGTTNGSANTVSITISAVNDAPVLDAAASPVLSTIAEDAGDDDGSSADGDDDASNNANNTGDSVASIVSDGSVTDVDGSPVEAIAVTAVDNTNGIWQYSLDNGTSWTNFTATTGTSVDLTSAARLLDGSLAGAATHLIRFVADADYSGTATITIRAWDRSTGSAGGVADASVTGGTSAFSAISDTASITVTSVNDAPVFAGLDAMPTFVEGGSAVVLDSTATIADTELASLNGGNGDFGGASLTIARNGGTDLEDDFGFDVTGALFTVSGNMLQSGGQSFATFAEVGGTLTISFTSLATPATTALVNDVLQRVTYSNTSNDPDASVQLDWTFSDGNVGSQGSGGIASATGSVTVSNTGVNDEPTLTATGGNPTHVEGGAAVDLFNSVTSGTVETGQTITGLTLTITNIADGADEILVFDGTDVALTNGTALVSAANSLSVSVSVTGSTATITATGGTLSPAALQTLVDGITYRNTSDNPTTTANRVVTVTELVDSGGTANSGDDTAALAVTSTVTITAVNDAPVLANLTGDQGVLTPGASALIDAGADATLANADSPDYSGGVLRIVDKDSNNTASGSFSVDGTTVISGGDGGIAANETIQIGGVTIGTVDATENGQGGNTLAINLTANADDARIQTLIRNLAWGASAGTGAQTFTLSLDDNDGTANGGAQSTSVDFSMILGNKPVVANLAGDTVAFVENLGAVALDNGGNVTISDADNNLGSGTLSLAFQSGQTANDRLLIDTSGSVTLSAGQTAASSVSVGGVVIGTLANGATGGANETLGINFNANATPSRVQTLVGALSYDNSSDDPATHDRTLGLTITDGTSISSDTATLTVTVAATDDAPTLVATGSNPNFVEGDPAADLFNTVSTDTVEAGQTLTTLSLTVTNIADGAAEVLTIDGSVLALTDANTLTTASNGLTATVSVLGNTATVTLTGGTLSAAAAETLVDTITYRNTSETPTGGSRVVTITGLTDSGSATGSNANSAPLTLSSSVNVLPVNDAPVIGNAHYHATSQVVVGTGAQSLGGLSAVTVSNLDSSDYNGGQLTISQNSGTTNGNWGVDGTIVTAGGDASLSAGETVLVNGVTIGTVDITNDGQGGSDLTINFSTADATNAAIQTLIRSITYEAPSTVGARDFTLTLNDADGTANGGDQDSSVNFLLNATGTPPVIGNLDGDSFTFTEGDSATALDVAGDLTVSDADSADFDTGTLTVSFESGMQAEDRLLIDVSGTVSLSAGQANGSVVSVGGVPVGTIVATGTGGAGEDLVITLTSGATPATIQTLLRALQYDNTAAGAPTDGNRQIGVQIAGGTDNALSDMAVVTINVNPAPAPGGGSTGGRPLDMSAGDDDDSIGGTNFNDTINGGGGNDRITGNRGEDLLSGGSGVDTLRGGDGDDQLFLGSGNDRGVAGDGNDRLNGGSGNDFMHGGTGEDTLRGGVGDDTVYGGLGNDTIGAGRGDDIVFAGGGADRVNGGGGSDQIAMGSQDDRAFGGSGNDSLAGGEGRDTLNGGMGDDMLRGGAGSDVFIFVGGRGNDRIADFDAQEDQLTLREFGFTSRDQALSFGAQSGDDFVFTFADGSTLTLIDVTRAELETADLLF